MRGKQGKTNTSHFAPKNNAEGSLNRGNSQSFYGQMEEDTPSDEEGNSPGREQKSPDRD